MISLAPRVPSAAQARVGVIVRAPAREVLIERAKAAYDGGLRILVLPISIPFVAEIAGEISDYADDVTVGICDVMSADHVNIALAAGAPFVLMPFLDEDLEKSAQARGLTVIAGIATPSELRIARTRTQGPVSAHPIGALGGPKYFATLASMYPDLPLAATGHIGPDDSPAYLEAGASVVIVDQGLFPSDNDGASNEVIAMRAGALVEVCGEIKDVLPRGR